MKYSLNFFLMKFVELLISYLIELSENFAVPMTKAQFGDANLVEIGNHKRCFTLLLLWMYFQKNTKTPNPKKTVYIIRPILSLYLLTVTFFELLFGSYTTMQNTIGVFRFRINLNFRIAL